MKYMTFFKRIFIILLVVLCVFCSCKKSLANCEELLMFSVEYGIENYADNGKVFLKSAEEGDAFFISHKIKKIMYGERFVDALDKTEDFAIYVSASTPYEIAIFKCYSRNDTEKLLQMCYERADELKVALRFGKWESATKDILIRGYKNYVVFLFTDSADRNEDIAYNLENMISN